MTRVWTLALVAALMLAGCVQPAPTPSVTSTPSPTFLCTPEAGGAESACTEQQHREMQQRDALYAEAEQVYREYQAEFLKVIRAGGAHALPKSLLTLIGNESTAQLILAETSSFKARGLSIRGPGANISLLRRVPGVTRNGSSVTLEFCVDSRSTPVYRGKKRVSSGVIGTETAYFGKVESGLRIVYIKGERHSCE